MQRQIVAVVHFWVNKRFGNNVGSCEIENTSFSSKIRDRWHTIDISRNWSLDCRLSQPAWRLQYHAWIEWDQQFYRAEQVDRREQTRLLVVCKCKILAKKFAAAKWRNSWVSSAWNWWPHDESEIGELSGRVYWMTKRRLRREPSDTPWWSGNWSEKEELTILATPRDAISMMRAMREPLHWYRDIMRDGARGWNDQCCRKQQRYQVGIGLWRFAGS